MRVRLSAVGRERQADEVHAVVQQRQHHRQQGRFLAAVHRAGRGEDCRRLAIEPAVQPQRTGAVEEVLERRGHVAEAGRAAEHQAVALAAGRRGSRTAARPPAPRGAVASVVGDTGGTVRSRAVTPGDRFDAAHDVPREFGRRAVPRVVEHEDSVMVQPPRPGRSAA